MADLFSSADPMSVFEGAVFAQVALETGLEKAGGLTYVVPDSMGELAVGDRVLVPLGRRNTPVAGYVLSLSRRSEVEPGKLKAIAARDPRAVNLPGDLVELGGWMSRYYCCPLGVVLATMLPAAVKKGTGLVRRTFVMLHDPIAAASLESIVKHHGLRGKQADVLGRAMELAQQNRLPVEVHELARAAGAKSVSPVKQLVEKGLLRETVKTRVEAVWAQHAVEPDRSLTLNVEQRAAVEAITATAGRFAVHLLHGVTGSGKTEVYIRAIEPVVEAGKLAVVMVPEIALTPQTVGRFIGRFGRVAVLHSGLTAAQRHEQWQLIRQGWAQVVVGARSAVFAPAANLGLVIVDEEHDSSYKQDNAPRYHARDVAIKRAQMAGATVVLGSATPSLESYHNATVRRSYNLIRLEKRATPAPLPRVQIVDLMEERRKRYETTGGAGVHLLSLALERGLMQVFAAGDQAMLLLNRRGYANYVACPDQRCGWVMSCEHCSVNMVYHRDGSLPPGGLLRCHYCGFENILLTQCPVCSRKVTTFGLGTQRVEDEVARKFPNVKSLRMDSDSMHTSRHYERALESFRRGEVQLLIGTQMIAKGLDFPRVRMVGVISADTALNLPDFRSSERTFQLVCQVAGRSGRSEHPGAVIVQSFTPEHPAIQLAAKHDYRGFAELELKLRERAALPPTTRMARIVVRDAAEEKARKLAEEVAAVLQQIDAQHMTQAVFRGPHPAPIARIGGYFRWQVEITAPDALKIQTLLVNARAKGLLISDGQMAVDVDPISLM